MRPRWISYRFRAILGVSDEPDAMIIRFALAAIMVVCLLCVPLRAFGADGGVIPSLNATVSVCADSDGNGEDTAINMTWRITVLEARLAIMTTAMTEMGRPCKRCERGCWTPATRGERKSVRRDNPAVSRRAPTE